MLEKRRTLNLTFFQQLICLFLFFLSELSASDFFPNAVRQRLICVETSANYTRNPYINKEIWDNLSEYFLPITHPMKLRLDQIFQSKNRISANQDSLKQAGFRNTAPTKWRHTIVASHPSLKGYLVKLYTDDQKEMIGWVNWKERIIGAKSIHEAINRHGYEHIMKVPRKWIYPLPNHFPYRASKQEKNFILLVEDMNILPKQRNILQWRSLELPKSTLNALYTILQEVGLYDSVYIFNIPFCRDGKIAFIDTEFHHMWPVPFQMLRQYLCQKNRTYWKALIDYGGPR